MLFDCFVILVMTLGFVVLGALGIALALFVGRAWQNRAWVKHWGKLREGIRE